MASNKVRKLIVEVIEARGLAPKDGKGTSSPYVIIDYYGQRRRTRTVVSDLNPTWNEVLEFNVSNSSKKQTDQDQLVFGDMLELDVLHDKNYGPTRRNNFLGRIRLSSTQFVSKGEEALIHYGLEKKNWYNWIQGEIGLKIYYAEEELPPPPPPPPLPAVEEVKAESEAEASIPPESASSPPSVPAVDPPENGEHAPPDVAPPDPPEDTPPAPEENVPQPAENAATEIISQPPPPPPADQSPSPIPSTPEHVHQPPPPPEDKEDIVIEPTETTIKWAPQQPSQNDFIMQAPSIARSMSEAGHLKVPVINGPQPIPRSASVASFMSDFSDQSGPIERSSFDLVEKMHYVFVRVVKARYLPTNGNPVVKITVSSKSIRSKPARKANFFEWDQTFAFSRDAPDSSSILEISVWDPLGPITDGAGNAKFMGGICFDVTEVPLRDPPDSPLATQWYRLEGGGAHRGDLMLATWIGTQADESFPDAWKTDTAGDVNSRAKVYLSPKLWYLRATVLEAQDILPLTALKETSLQVRAQLGFQFQKTKATVTRNGIPLWNEDLLFVASEPFSDQLVFTLDSRQPKGIITLGAARVPLCSIERRVDDRHVASRWFNLEDPKDEKRVYKGRLHLKLCFDGGYHVMDEAVHVCSDYRPTARQLWKPPVGTVELGIIGCKNLLPMKTINGKGSTDAYCVGKYGPKWVRTRVVADHLEPRWNEQYTWKVYDPCTVLTIGVFDSWGGFESDGEKEATRPDIRIGKVRIRISTLQTGRVYRNSYPMILLGNAGLKRMGELEVAVRFIRTAPTLDFLHVYSQPLLPLMHHIKPFGGGQQEMLRSIASKIVSVHLSRSEPPLRREIVLYMLDADSHSFSMRKIRANWCRIINVIAGLIDILRWIDDTRVWKNPTSTTLVHALLIILVWFPNLIIPTLSFYVFVVGAWNYRFKSRAPLPHFDPKLSLADSVDREELDEEFDGLPSNRPPELVRARYDKLRALGTRLQIMLGDAATQGERVQAMVTWRDPRATGIFIGLCFLVAMILYLVPSKMVAMAFGFYYFRHPIFRDRMPSPALNFFKRLPSLSDRLM
ncbi:hypothetical protein ACFE04_027780 [Oxalis oulophora]